MTAATRRHLFEAAGGAGLLAVAGAAFAKPDAADARRRPGALPLDPAAHPDAELIALCAEFDDSERLYQGLHGDGAMAHLAVADEDTLRARLAPLEAGRDALLDRICAMRATTLDGLRARAFTLALYEPARMLDPDPDQPSRMLAALLRDMTGGSVE